MAHEPLVVIEPGIYVLFIFHKKCIKVTKHDARFVLSFKIWVTRITEQVDCIAFCGEYNFLLNRTIVLFF